MSNNIDIRDDSDKRSLDISLSGSANAPDKNGSASVSPDDRQKKAQMMARQIAMNIGGDYDDDGNDVRDDEDGYSDAREKISSQRQYREEATRERTVPSRPVRDTREGREASQRGSSRASSGSASHRHSGSSGNKRPSAQQHSSAQRSSQQRRDGSRSSRSAQKKRRKRRSSGAGTAIGFMLGFIVVLLGVGYFIGLILTNGMFLPNTTINGVDVSKMTLAQATEALTSGDQVRNLVMYKADGSTIIIPATDFDYGDDMDQQIQKIYSGINRKLWFKSLLGSNEYTVTPDVTYDEAKLSQALDKIVWGVTESQNAYITRTSEGFIIVDAVQGDKVDYSKLKPFLLQQVREGNFTINITDCDCFYKPEIVATDLQDKLDNYKTIGDINIKIDFDYTQEELTMDDYSTWIQFQDDGSYTVNRDEVAQYVGHLADKYDTYGTTRKFHATLQGDIYVPQGKQGTYGWMIDQEKTTDKLVKMLEEGTSDTIDPVYATRLDRNGVAFFTYKSIESSRTAETDIGNTYIEVDLTAQHMWYYENGEVKFETDQIVSGLPTSESRITPEGVYEILDKNTDYRMSGEGYTNVHCNYFIRVSYEGIGFHDLSRSSYGGQIYLTNGSHGCINMKLAEVKQLYNMVAGGTPVIMYY